jgi:hypothetical protein
MTGRHSTGTLRASRGPYSWNNDQEVISLAPLSCFHPLYYICSIIALYSCVVHNERFPTIYYLWKRPSGSKVMYIFVHFPPLEVAHCSELINWLH